MRKKQWEIEIQVLLTTIIIVSSKDSFGYKHYKTLPEISYARKVKSREKVLIRLKHNFRPPLKLMWKLQGKSSKYWIP